MTIETFTPKNMFKPIGPYSHIAKSGSFISISGTPGINFVTGELAGDDAYLQARQIVRNMCEMLKSVGSDLEDVISVNVFLKRVEDFDEMNRACAEEFGNHLPTRTVICVVDLPKKSALMTMNLTAIQNTDC